MYEVERDHARVREQLLSYCRAERIEPPTSGRVDRIVRSALHQAETALTCRIAARIPAAGIARLEALVDVEVDSDDVSDAPGEGGVGDDVLGLVKSVPGNVSLESMLTEIRKLRVARAIGLPAGLFADVAPKVLAGWRALAAVESPSHLRTHPPELRLTLLAALLHSREREIIDTLVDLLISTVHRINARADRRVTQELVNAFKKVTVRRTFCSRSPRRRWTRRMIRCARWCSRRCLVVSRRCGSWCTSTRRRGRYTAVRCRPR